MDEKTQVGAEPFVRRCLKCRKEFEPTCRRRNWICPGCTAENDSIRVTKEINMDLLHRSGVLPEDLD